MGSITTGVGLISGLDYQSIIDKLMEIEKGPVTKLQARMSNIDAQRTALLSVSAQITSLLSNIALLSKPASFLGATAKSSLADVLMANASTGAKPGSYSFTVRALASTNQFVTRGYGDSAAPLDSGTLTIESARARVNTSTTLSELNGYTGVRRGSFKITNQAGQSATVNISDALTVGEVLDKINATGISVEATVRGDGIVLTDTSAGEGSLRVKEVGSGHAAADLGFGTGHTIGTDGELAGTAIIYLSGSTPVSALNDGLGVRHSSAGGDFMIDAGGTTFSVDMSNLLKHDTSLARLNHGQGVRLGRVRITSKDGTIRELDLTGAKTINDVKQAIQGAFSDSRLNVVLAGSHLIVSDSTDTADLEEDQRSDFIIEDLTGNTAHDLGIDGRSESGKITGRDVLSMSTLADVVNAINYAVGNKGEDKQPVITASISEDRQSLTLRTASGPFTIKVSDANAAGLKTLADLGLKAGSYYDMNGGAQAVGGRIISSLDTVLLKTLNGGAGLTGTTMTIEANGQSVSLDFSEARTLADIVALINGAADGGGNALGVEASYDATGTRLVVSNTTADEPITISGDLAEELGLAQTGSSIRGANLQRQYINEATLISDLNMGRGVAGGSFKITDSNGVYGTVNLSYSSLKTVGDIIDSINALKIGVTASINATGDGLLITDTAGGTATMKIEEDGGTTARDLNLLGSARDGVIDGSFEFKLDIGGSDTLESLATRIGASTTLASATVLDDGTSVAPYRLNITSLASGAAGELIIDDGSTNLGVTTLTRAQDARVFYGGNGDSGILLTSSDNTFDNVVSGVTLTASSTSDTPVTITVERNVDSLVTAMTSLVDAFNTLSNQINEYQAYDAENKTLGILQGDSTLQMIEQRLYRMFTSTANRNGSLQRLSDIGLRYGSGEQLTFDEDKFRAAVAANPDAVQTFFAETDKGVAVQLKEQIEAITDTDGLIEKKNAALQSRRDLLQERVDQLNEQLDRKRARLLSQFQAMEAALAQLQSQQQTIANWADSLISASSG